MGLSKDVKAGDYDHLVETMQLLGDVKDRQAETDKIFEPLGKTIELLQSYNQEMPESVHHLLEVCYSLLIVGLCLQ